MGHGWVGGCRQAHPCLPSYHDTAGCQIKQPQPAHTTAGPFDGPRRGVLRAQAGGRALAAPDGGPPAQAAPDDVTQRPEDQHADDQRPKLCERHHPRLQVRELNADVMAAGGARQWGFSRRPSGCRGSSKACCPHHSKLSRQQGDSSRDDSSKCAAGAGAAPR
jgi:hypothetical protein